MANESSKLEIGDTVALAKDKKRQEIGHVYDHGKKLERLIIISLNHEHCKIDVFGEFQTLAVKHEDELTKL